MKRNAFITPVVIAILLTVGSLSSEAAPRSERARTIGPAKKPGVLRRAYLKSWPRRLFRHNSVRRKRFTRLLSQLDSIIRSEQQKPIAERSAEFDAAERAHLNLRDVWMLRSEPLTAFDSSLNWLVKNRYAEGLREARKAGVSYLKALLPQ
jgi:hypothetical protein